MSFDMLRALLFAGECVLASLALPLLAFAVTAPMRRAALRHLVWTTLFGTLAVLPFVALALPPRLIVEHVAAPAPVVPMVAAPVLPAPPPSFFTPENLVTLLAALWLAGIAWQCFRMGLGGIGLMRLRRASLPFPAGIEPGCDVRLSDGEAGPSTFGILHPIVLLPRSAEGWPVARLDAVLRHEAAHVARRDAATQMLARLVCAVFWFNPLLWLGHRALRRAAEIAADDAVLASGMTPSVYAAELVRLAAERQGVVPGVAMAGPPLRQRVQSVLAENSSRKGVTGMDMARMGLLGLTAALLLGAARFDIAVAQDAPSAPPPTVAAPPAPDFSEDTASPLQRVHNAQAAERGRMNADAAAARAAQAAERAGAARLKADEAAARAREMADTAPPAESHGSASASQQAESSADGVTTVRRTHRGDGKDDNEIAEARRDAMTHAREAQRQAMKAIADAHIDQQVAKAMADAHVSETIARALADAHVDAVTAKAIADAHIEQRIAEVMVKVQTKVDAAVRASVKIPPIPPVPPVPPPPALPPVPPVP